MKVAVCRWMSAPSASLNSATITPKRLLPRSKTLSTTTSARTVSSARKGRRPRVRNATEQRSTKIETEDVDKMCFPVESRAKEGHQAGRFRCALSVQCRRHSLKQIDRHDLVSAVDGGALSFKIHALSPIQPWVSSTSR